MRTRDAHLIRRGITIGRGQIFTIQHQPDWSALALGFPWGRGQALAERASYRTVQAWRSRNRPITNVSVRPQDEEDDE